MGLRITYSRYHRMYLHSTSQCRQCGAARFVDATVEAEYTTFIIGQRNPALTPTSAAVVSALSPTPAAAVAALDQQSSRAPATSLPVPLPLPPQVEPSVNASYAVDFAFWICACSNHNEEYATACVRCKAPRPEVFNTPFHFHCIFDYY